MGPYPLRKTQKDGTLSTMTDTPIYHQLLREREQTSIDQWAWAMHKLWVIMDRIGRGGGNIR